jgi:hypothetical protein
MVLIYDDAEADFSVIGRHGVRECMLECSTIARTSHAIMRSLSPKAVITIGGGDQ